MINKIFPLPGKGDSKATLTSYILQNYPKFSANRLRPFVLVIPGGGYSHYGQREQEAIAIKMNSLGFHSGILNYSLAPMAFPAALCDAANALAFIRKNAKEWHVDPDKIILCGFSAGGHLAASLGAYWNSGFLKDYISYKAEEIKPNFLILSYPVITAEPEYTHEESIKNVIGAISKESGEKIAKSLGKSSIRDVVSIEKNISKDFPPTFIWHTKNDEAVSAENTLLMANALFKKDINFEYHLFNRGCHALGLASEETANPDGSNAEKECEVWPDLFLSWFKGL